MSVRLIYCIIIHNLECILQFNAENILSMSELCGKRLKTISRREKTLGVIVHNCLKPARQYAEAAKKAYRILIMFKRTVVSRERNIIIRLNRQWYVHI